MFTETYFTVRLMFINYAYKKWRILLDLVELTIVRVELTMFTVQILLLSVAVENRFLIEMNFMSTSTYVGVLNT